MANQQPAAEAYELRDRVETSTLVDPESQLELRSTDPPALERSTAFLDGLRGLAAVSVFIQHYIGGFDANIHEHGFGENGNYYLASLPFLRIIWNGGNAGVAIFFVLSGYVLTKSPLRLLKNGRYDACRRSLISAVVRRPIRLYLPPVAVALVMAVLMQVPGGLVEDAWFSQRKETFFGEMGNWLTQSISFFNPFQAHGSDKAWYTYNFVAWTLPLELKGSILVYALIFPYAYGEWVSLGSLFLLGIASFLLLQFGQWSMACFIMGLLLCFIDSYSLDTSFFTRRHVSPQNQSIIWHVFFFAGWYLLTQPTHAGSPEFSYDTPGWGYLHSLIPAAYDDKKYYRYWQAWGALFLVYATLRITWAQKFLGRSSIRYLGKLSFMLYLIHTGFFRIFGDRVARMFGRGLADDGGSGWFDNKLRVPDIGPAAMSLRFLLSMAITFPSALVVSDIGFRMIDVRSVRLSKKFAAKLGLDSGGARRQGRVEDMRLPTHDGHVTEPA